MKKMKKKFAQKILIGTLSATMLLCGGLAIDNLSRPLETASAAVIAEETRAESGLSFTAGEMYNVDASFTAVPKTFEAYVKLASNSRQGCMFGNYVSGSSGAFSFELNYDSTKKISYPRLYYNTGTTDTQSSKTIDIKFTGTSLPIGEWIHLVCVHDGTTATAYVNNELIETKTVTAVSHSSTTNVCVGGDHRTNNAQYFKGNIKGMKFYSDARTVGEIAVDYGEWVGENAGTIDASDDNLLCAYDFTRADDLYLQDLSANGYDIDFTGDEWLSQKEAVTDYAYSFAVVGDTQCVNELNPQHMDTLYDWIIANKESKKIEYVFGLGDITQSSNDDTSAVEWDKAVEVIAKLDAAGIPYSLIRGNHDDTVKFNEHFNTETYKAQFQGFYEEDKIDNSWTTFTAGTTDYLLVTLDYGADDQELAWAGKVIEAFPNHKVIITTHAYMYRDGTTLSFDDVCSPADSNDWSVDPYKVYNNGDQMWDKLVSRHGNIFLVLSGHDPCEDVVTTQTKGIHGNTVTQMLIDPQGMDSAISGSCGMVCMLYFSEDGKSIDVEWYSTIKGQYYKESNQYTINVYDETVNSHAAATAYEYDNDSHWYVCSDCGVTVESAHEYGEWVVTEATATMAGNRTKTCVCGHTVTEALTAYDFGNAFGATIRVKEPNGIRFRLQLSDTTKTQIFAANSNLTLGMFIFPADKIDSYKDNYASLTQKINLTFKETDLYKVDGYWYANGVMTNLYLQNITREFIGVGYIYDGTTYTYSNFTVENNVRSMLDVAVAAYQDPDAAAYKNSLAVYIEKAIYAEYGIKEVRTTKDDVTTITFTDGTTTWDSYEKMKAANPISIALDMDRTKLAVGDSLAFAAKIKVGETVVDLDVPFEYAISDKLTLQNGILTANIVGDANVTVSLASYSASVDFTVWKEVDGVMIDGVRDEAYGEFTETTVLDDNRWYNISAVKTENGVFLYTQGLFNTTVIGDPGTGIAPKWNTSTNFEFRFNEGKQFYVNAAGENFGVDSFLFNVEEVDGKYLHTAEIFVSKDLIVDWSDDKDLQLNYAWMTPNEKAKVITNLLDYQYMTQWGNNFNWHAYQRFGAIATGFNEMVDNLHISAKGLIAETSPLEDVTIDGVIDAKEAGMYGEYELNVKGGSTTNVKATVIDGDIYMAITITHGAWSSYYSAAADWWKNDNFQMFINDDEARILFLEGNMYLPAYFSDGEAITTPNGDGTQTTVIELYKKGDYEAYNFRINANSLTGEGFGWNNLLWNDSAPAGYLSADGITTRAEGVTVDGVKIDGVFDDGVYTNTVRNYSLTADANGASVHVMGLKTANGVAFATTVTTTKDANTTVNGGTSSWMYTNPDFYVNGVENFLTSQNVYHKGLNWLAYCKTVDNGDGTYTHSFEYFIEYDRLGITASDTVRFSLGGWYETDWKWVFGGNSTTPTHTLTENGVLEAYEKMSNSEFYSQVAAYGSPSQQSSKARARISFAVKMMAGTKFTFTGDSTVYDWAINEVENPSSDYPKAGSDYDSGWISGNTYSTKFDLYPIIVLKKDDKSNFTADEITSLHTMFQVDGYKLSPVTADNEGMLTGEEYNAQFAHFGSVPVPNSTARARISFAIKMKAGTKITFNPGTSGYYWAVVETTNTASTSYAKDSGWLTTTNTYVTEHDGTYPVITVKKGSEGTTAFTRAELATLHTYFTVEGEKGVDSTVIARQDYETNSVAHRGYSTTAPENTLAAYRLAAQNGFSMVECDVEFTKDGVPVLLHDATIDRTSNGTGNIADLTLEQVRAYDFGSWKSAAYAGEQIPTFAEFIALCKELDLHPYIEIKNTISAEYAKTLYDIVAEAEMLDSVTWISFSATSLSLIKDLDDTARLGLVVSDVTADVITTAQSLQTENNEVFIDCYFELDTDDVSLCQNAGFALEVWTVDSTATLLALDSYVSGVTSNWLVAGMYLG